MSKRRGKEDEAWKARRSHDWKRKTDLTVYCTACNAVTQFRRLPDGSTVRAGARPSLACPVRSAPPVVKAKKCARCGAWMNMGFGTCSNHACPWSRRHGKVVG
jgi:hypothetical protein